MPDADPACCTSSATNSNGFGKDICRAPNNSSMSRVPSLVKMPCPTMEEYPVTSEPSSDENDLRLGRPEGDDGQMMHPVSINLAILARSYLHPSGGFP